MKMSDVKIGMRLRDSQGHVVIVTEYTPRGFRWRPETEWAERRVIYEPVTGGEHFGVNGEAYFEPV